MKYEKSNTNLYCGLVSASFLLLIQSLQLYAEAIESNIHGNPKNQASASKILKAIQSCGQTLQNLPQPEAGTENADRCFRSFGLKVSSYVRSLNSLNSKMNTFTNPWDSQAFIRSSNEIKLGFSEVVRLFENTYPGYLAKFNPSICPEIMVGYFN